MKVVVSACLLGQNCKYNGGCNYSQAVIDYLKDREVIPVCPEVLAGLGVPRTPVEIVNGEVKDRAGNSVDSQLREAVAQILAQLDGEEVACAVLKSRSPTCGVKQIYDGSFSGKLINGMGLLAEALHQAGYPVIDSEDICDFSKK